jgi:hypothetical protein
MGIHKYIESPERMKELFEAYREEIKGSPIEVQDFVGKDGDEVHRKKERPLTMEGFENYLFKMDVITDVSDYFENKDNRYKDFLPICRAIKRMIRQDQIEGGMAGIYNPSITQRLNNLVEKIQEDGSKEITVKVKYEQKRIDGSVDGTAPGAIEGPEGS